MTERLSDERLEKIISAHGKRPRADCDICQAIRELLLARRVVEAAQVWNRARTAKRTHCGPERLVAALAAYDAGNPEETT